MRELKKCLSQELRDYFSELIQPLVINECLEQIEQKRKINELEERVPFKENTINQLLIKCDDNEQYSRRNCLRGFMESNLKK